MKSKIYIGAGIVFLIIAAILIVSTILLAWPKAAAKTNPIVTVAPPPYDPRPDKIDYYFYLHKMPLDGYGIWFVNCADTYHIDYNLLAAISVIESQGGKRYPKVTNNPFGWDSAKSDFSDITTGLCFISQQLGTGKFYAGKTTIQKLQIYNPPKVNPKYASEVTAVMKQIDQTVVPADYNSPQ